MKGDSVSMRDRGVARSSPASPGHHPLRASGWRLADEHLSGPAGPLALRARAAAAPSRRLSCRPLTSLRGGMGHEAELCAELPHNAPPSPRCLTEAGLLQTAL